MTASTGDRAHLSIGEVLANLRDEFPDVTISKIRFLESQGLIDPERTPSGYRKFYAEDLTRLRWILFQQREHFLPLRVIKERLDRFGSEGAPPLDSSNGDTPVPPRTVDPPRVTPRPQPHRPAAVDTPTLPLDVDVDDRDETDDSDEGVDAPEVAEGEASEPVTNELTRAALLSAAALTEEQLDELESFGFVAPAVGAGERALYDEHALAIACIAAGFHSRGIEARHLKMYQHIADREAALFAQVLMPYVRQRNPDARARLQGELQELTRLGRRMRIALLRTSLRQTLVE